MNETTNANDNLSKYDNLTLITEMTLVNDAVDVLIGSHRSTPAMTTLAEPLMRRYNVLRNEMIRRTSHELK